MKEIEVNNHKICGGKCKLRVMKYPEYSVKCELCGGVWQVLAPRVDDAVGLWNSRNNQSEVDDE